METITLDKDIKVFYVTAETFPAGIQDATNKLHDLDRAFKKLLKCPGLDPQGYCVEWYATDKEAVKCMIRLDQ